MLRGHRAASPQGDPLGAARPSFSWPLPQRQVASPHGLSCGGGGQAAGFGNIQIRD